MLDRFRASHPDFHIDARAEPVDDRDEAIHREPPQVRIPNPREVSRRDPRSAMRGAYSQVFPIECLYDFGGQNSLELFSVGVLMPQIAEHIAASPHHSQFFIFHRNISFNLFKRSFIKSISRKGVLTPCVDFFWNACTTQISSPTYTA
jgi:hypothetical protein